MKRALLIGPTADRRLISCLAGVLFCGMVAWQARGDVGLDRQGPDNRLLMSLDCDFSLLLGDAKVPRQCKLEVHGADMMRREVRETDTGTTIVWTGHPKAGADFKVTARLRPDGKGGWSYGFDYAGNVSGLAVEELGFPVITVPRTDRTEVLYPRQTGMLRRPDWTKYKSGETVQAFGPNTVGFHFAATIDAQAGGWYVDQRGDARKRPARFSFTAAPSNRVTIAVTTYPSVHLDRASSGALPFEGTIRPFRGDWFAAASIYRDWLKTQDWYVKARSRDFGKLRDVALWMWNRGRSHEVMPSVERFVDETGLPAALDWYWWHEIPYDTEYPFFWPPREGERAFADAVARLHRRGVYVQTYTNGMLWDMDRPNWNEGGSEGQMLYRSGGPNMTVFNVYLNHRMAIMCGEAPVFQARLREVERKLAATGLDALYLDMIGNCMAACWNPKHRHAPGGGTVMADGYRQLLADVRTDNPGVHLSSEEEGEAYVDALDSLIVLYAASERLGKGVAPEHEMLPIFPMLYHGCVALYGSYSVIDGITPWDEKWGARPAIDEARWAGKFPDQFALEFARGVTWGIQPTVHKLLPEHQTDAKWAAEWKFVKDTAAFYHANRDFLFDGEMQSPGAMTCPRRPVDFFIRGCYTKEENFRTARQEAVPTVLHSVWRTRDGRTAAVLVNWTREEQPYRLVTSSGTTEGHLPARSWKLLRQGGTQGVVTYRER